jgi:hypothetical protein
MLNSFRFLSTKKYLFLAFCGTLLCLICFGILENKLGAQILDVLPRYNLNEVEKYFLIYGEEGRRLYAWASLTLDLLFPVCYMALFIGLILLLTGSSIFRWLIILPIMLGVIDITENIQICFMLIQYPEITDVQVNLASGSTSFKHYITNGTLLCIILLSIYRMMSKLSR